MHFVVAQVLGFMELYGTILQPNVIKYLVCKPTYHKTMVSQQNQQMNFIV